MVLKKVCFLDGDSLCIVNNNFVDLVESEAMFIKLTSKQIKEFNEMKK